MKLFTLMKKEFFRFFRDPRLILAMLLPGVFIFALYNIMGSAINREEASEYKVYLSGESAFVDVIEQAISERGDKVEWLPLESEEEARAEVKEGKAAAILTFSENFDEKFALFDNARVGIIYDSGSSDGSYFYSIASSVLIRVGMPFEIDAESVRSGEEVGSQIMNSVLPFIIVCFIFTACMSVTLESVAGEKERGTLATVLVTSVRRSDIALGKVIPLSCVSMLGALSSFLGLVLSMPKLTGISFGLTMYSAWSYVLLLPLVLCVVPLIVGAIAAVSTLARSVKEASAYTSVFMILVMVISLVTSFVPSMGDWTVAVPVLNAVVCMQGVLAGALPVWQSLVSVGANLLYTAILVFLMTKMLSSERIMFGK